MARANKPAGSKKAGRRLSPSAPAPESDAVEVEPAKRLAMIAEAAYYRAEQRGFEPGHETQDWLEAERAIDLALKRALIK